MDSILHRQAAWVARMGGWMAVVLACAVAGCATLRQDVPRPASRAIEHPLETTLGRAFARQLGADPGLSGFRLLPSGQEAFVARAALADAAERTLDVQYHIVVPDGTGTQLLHAAMRAAERGVRVRILIDDLDTRDRDDQLAALATHPNVHVRVFNPFSLRRVPGLLRLFEYIGDIDRLNRRMHNKLWIADNAAALIGGRNLGNAYFGANGAGNFADLDVLAAGPVVIEASRSFDAFWNCDWAVPIQAFTRVATDGRAFEQQMAEMARQVRDFQDSDYARHLREPTLQTLLGGDRFTLTVASAALIYDPPAKLEAPADAPVDHLLARLRDVIESAQQEMIVISPYIVPSEAGIDLICGLAQRGTAVRILTNSLASTDVVAVHAGYARYRSRLLACGVSLHEWRPTVVGPGTVRRVLSSGVSLHAKAIVVDGKAVLLGSMNLDPRSRHSNTEIGVLIDSEVLGRQLSEWFEEATSLGRAFRLELTEPGNPAAPLVWIGGDQDDPVRFDSEPLVRWWQQLAADLLGLLVPEALL